MQTQPTDLVALNEALTVSLFLSLMHPLLCLCVYKMDSFWSWVGGAVAIKTITSAVVDFRSLVNVTEASRMIQKVWSR